VTLEADLLADRRRLRRRMAAWRAAAVLIALAAVVGLILGLDRGAIGDRIAVVHVEGVIVQDVERDRALEDLAEDDAVKAVLVRIDSPGGTFGGGETLHDGLRRLAEAKPVVAIMGELATSAAYMTAIATDRIFARKGTITGSIGVIWQTADVSGLLDTLGVRTEAMRSGPYKALPSPLEPMTEPIRAEVQGLVDAMQDLFVAMVVARRGFDAAKAESLADGRVFPGQQALDLGLIDAIGGETEALAWLEEARGIDPDLPLIDATWGDEPIGVLDGVLGWGGKTLLPETLILDGLVSVWHP
jgi:protease-4